MPIPRVPATAALGAALGAFASAVLAGSHLGLFGGSVPGCGADGCGALTSGVWGVVPGTEVPWSMVGLAWFAGLGAGCVVLAVAARHCTALRWAARIGLLGSLGLVALMAFLALGIGAEGRLAGAWCGWCLAVHAGSLVVWWGLDAPRRAEPRAAGLAAGLWTGSGTGSGAGVGGGARCRAAVGTALAVGASVVIALALASSRTALRRGAEVEAAAERLATEIRSDARAIDHGDRSAGEPPAATDRSRLRRAFGPTRVFGPADAAIRVVVFSDYQCADCGRIEGQLERVLARGDTAVVLRHFPLSSACNPGMPRDLHPDACRRARLAEAAGHLGGDAAYLAAHRALFALHAAPGADPADAIARATGLPRERLVEASGMPEIEATIAGDIADAVALGVTTTPLVFVNGREWRFALAGGSLDALVDRLSGDGSPAQPPVEPPDAAGKLVDDWRLTPRLADDALARIAEGGLLIREAGSARAPELRVWLDYRLPGAKAVDGALAEVAASGVAFSLHIHLYPVSSSCNPRSGVQGGDPLACLVAAAARAAESVGGAAGARAMHAALIERGPTIDGAGLVALASELGVDRDAFAALLAAGDALAEARRDADRLNDAMRPTVLPLVLIDGRPVPRWSHPGCSAADFFRLAIERAAAERGP